MLAGLHSGSICDCQAAGSVVVEFWLVGPEMSCPKSWSLGLGQPSWIAESRAPGHPGPSVRRSLLIMVRPEVVRGVSSGVVRLRVAPFLHRSCGCSGGGRGCPGAGAGGGGGGGRRG